MQEAEGNMTEVSARDPQSASIIGIDVLIANIH